MSRKRGDFVFHMGIVVGLAVYFAGLLVWFGSMFAGGGTEEHAVMSVVIPVVFGLGAMTVVGLGLIVLEGRRAGSDDGGES